MSRARPIILGEDHAVWFDTKRNGQRASDEQVELLALVERIELDDLLDISLTQGEVIDRLRKALGQDRIPVEVLERREKWREERHSLPPCRICDKEGDSTKHHFVNKWILRELQYYAQKWADRTKNTIPLCIHCHRGLHLRDDKDEFYIADKSIVSRLTEVEKAFVEAALQALFEEHPKLLILIARGDDSSYEARLVKDWIEGKFRPIEKAVSISPAKMLAQAA